VTISADERWLADARARAASGQWERPAEAVFAEMKREATERAVSAPVAPKCPYCDSHPVLLRFPRYETQTASPLLFCGTCYGFWAAGDALARGVSDPGFVHPALEAAVAPRRCRACFGHLKPDHSCAKCGEPIPALDCPSCRKTMERFEREGAQLDQCDACDGIWFDTGEIVRVFGLKPAQSLAMSTVDENATDDLPSPFWLAASVLGRLVFPYLPF
jgi:hypothetical protein